MKIVQLCGQLEGFGVTRFIIEQNNAFKKAGHDVDIYYCPSNLKRFKNIDNVIEYDYSPEMLKEINNADVVFISQLMPTTAEEKYREPFFKLITEDITKPKKVFFINCHNHVSHNIYGKTLLDDANFLNSFDFITTFSFHSKTFDRIRKAIGVDEAKNKFIQMYNPYEFDDNIKNNWISLKDKHKRITYIGRWVSIKHPEQLLNLHKVIGKDYEFEMRGIDRSIGTASVPDLFYELDKNNKLSFKERIKGPSKYTFPVSKKWKKENNIDIDDLLIDYPHNDKIFIFGTYKREDGLLAMSKSAFGSEFYRLKNSNLYGDNIEYAMMEIIEQGTIPIFDYHAGENIFICENGYPTNESMLDLNMGVYLKSDNSNINEVIDKINELYNNEKLYNDMRENCYENLKKHTNPVGIANRFLNEIF